MQIWKTVFALLLLMSFCALHAGCASRQSFEKADIDQEVMAAYLDDKPESLHPRYRDLLLEKERNEILNHMEIGREAFATGHFGCAKKSFDIVRNDISSIYLDTETARKARSLWYEEGMKKFRGEPYERAMAFYYSGLLFMKKGDFENARACFKSGILQDRFTEEKQNRCDFGLLIFLEALMSHVNGDRQHAEEVLDKLKRIRPEFDLPMNKNTLIIAETGTAPRKLADGPGHAELKFFRGKNFKEKRVEVDVGNGSFDPMLPIEDIFWQASTRGGRKIGKILEDQVVFRQKHTKAGQTLGDISSTVVMAAPLFSDSGAVTAAGGAIGVLGAVNMAMASNARPHADTRYWDNLPDTVHVFMADLPDKGSVSFRFKGSNGEVLPSLSRVVEFERDDHPLSLVWVDPREG
jgi:tetratricopeptide (TPR) repeat protein